MSTHLTAGQASSESPVLPATYNDVVRLDLRIGTVVGAVLHPKSRKPMYVLSIDFGHPFGTRVTSAQLVDNYPNPDALIGRQIAAVLNLSPKPIAGVTSEVLLLAAAGVNGSVLMVPDLVPDVVVANGVPVR